MTKGEAVKKLSAYIVCLKCEISGKECDDNCRYQYEAGTMGEIVEALETLIRAEPQERKTGRWRRIPMACYGGGTITEYECSNCEEHQVTTSNFCPNCGARMEVDKCSTS